MSTKLCPKLVTAVCLLKSYVFQNSAKDHPKEGLPLKESLLPRIFKSHPIWSRGHATCNPPSKIYFLFNKTDQNVIDNCLILALIQKNKFAFVMEKCHYNGKNS